MLRPLASTPKRVLRSFAPSSMPAMSRASYRWELRSAALVPLALGCVEGGVIGVIANKGFGAPNLAVATLTAAPALANLTSVFWTRAIHGADRVRATLLLQCGVIACVLLIAAAPFNAAGVWMLVGLQLLARSFMAGILTARSDLWRANYPGPARARVTGKLATTQTLVLGVMGLLIGWAMDLPGMGGNGFRFVYPAAAFAALAGVWAFSRVRWRGRAAHLRAEREGEGGRRQAGPRAMLGVLRSDRIYRRYMVAQFVLGVPNLAALPVFIIALEDYFPQMGYGPSITLTQALPILVPIVSIPLWARVLDANHIIRFRVVHSWVFVVANALAGVGFLLGHEWILFLSRFTLGVAFGGGLLAWQLGHHDFARRELAHVYMGVHVTLTGVRGLIAPFLGTAVYGGFAVALGEVSFALAPWRAWTFIACAAIGAAGALLFLRLHLDTRELQDRLDRTA